MRGEKLTECQLLKGATLCLGVEEVDDDDFKADHEVVHDEVFPSGVVHSDGVDERGEETGTTNKELLDGNTTGSLGVWEKFNKVSWKG